MKFDAAVDHERKLYEIHWPWIRAGNSLNGIQNVGKKRRNSVPAGQILSAQSLKMLFTLCTAEPVPLEIMEVRFEDVLENLQ